MKPKTKSKSRHPRTGDKLSGPKLSALQIAGLSDRVCVLENMREQVRELDRALERIDERLRTLELDADPPEPEGSSTPDPADDAEL
jgi:hypothetical protein